MDFNRLYFRHATVLAASHPTSGASRRRLRLSMPVALTAAMLGAAAPAVAHHSGAMFDPRKTVSLTGTVRTFQFRNPHCYIQLVVKNDQGVDEEWSVEMGAPMHLRDGGWKKNTLQAGDRIKVTVAPLRGGRHGGELRTATAEDGRPLRGLK